MTIPEKGQDTGGRVRLGRNERRASLIDAAARLIVTGGAHTVTMERVASEAGVTKAVPYDHFDNAKELLAELFEREADELARRVQEAVEPCEGFEDKIKATALAWMNYAADRGALAQFIFATDVPEPMAARRAARAAADRERWVQFVMEEADLDRPTAIVAVAVLLTGAAALLELWMEKVLPKHELVKRFGAIADGAVTALRRNDRGGW